MARWMSWVVLGVLVSSLLITASFTASQAGLPDPMFLALFLLSIAIGAWIPARNASRSDAGGSARRVPGLAELAGLLTALPLIIFFLIVWPLVSGPYDISHLLVVVLILGAALIGVGVAVWQSRQV